jgi:hypothetical protein
MVGQAGDDGADFVSPPMEQLTDNDKALLDLERSWWKCAGAKEQAIRDTVDCSTTRRYQRVNAIIDIPAALEHEPMLCDACAG